MYVAKLGELYFKTSSNNFETGKVYSVEFTYLFREANFFKQDNFSYLDDDPLLKFLKKTGARFYKIEEREVNIDDIEEWSKRKHH